MARAARKVASERRKYWPRLVTDASSAGWFGARSAARISGSENAAKNVASESASRNVP